MSEKEKLIEGLNKLNKDLTELGIQPGSTRTIDDVVFCLGILKPVQAAISKALQKATATRTIPKQSAIKPSRS